MSDATLLELAEGEAYVRFAVAGSVRLAFACTEERGDVWVPLMPHVGHTFRWSAP